MKIEELSPEWTERIQEKLDKLQERKIEFMLHVLLEKEADLYTAHCLEFDIVTDGNSEKDVKKEIIDAIFNHITFCIEYNNIDKIYNPAPGEYWNKFFMASNQTTKKPPSLKSGNPVEKLLKDVTFGIPTESNQPCYA